MNTHQVWKPQDPDTAKYNLRCNRNISEKMTKKDFVYDIRPPNQLVRKREGGRCPMVLPIQLRRKQSGKSPEPYYSVIGEVTLTLCASKDPKESRYSGDRSYGYALGDEECRHPGIPVIAVPGQRALGFECNFCGEKIATLMSLSTHVKSHCRRYCRICYWVQFDRETIEQHLQSSHSC